MPGRRDRYLEVAKEALVKDGLLRFDGTGLSCPAQNTPTLDEEGNLTLRGKLKQNSPGGVVTVVDKHQYKIRPQNLMTFVNTRQGAIVLTLPALQDVDPYIEYTIKDSGGSASKSFITVQSASDQDKIQTGQSLKINHDYGMVKLLSDGSQWLIMSEVTQLRPWRVQFV